MKMFKSFIFSLLFLFTHLAYGQVFSLIGNFDDTEDLLTVDFTLNSDAVVDFTSWGFFGGVNASGINISSGGFDSEIALYQNGALINRVDDVFNGTHPGSLGSSSYRDPHMSESLLAGDYRLYLGYWRTSFTLDEADIATVATTFGSGGGADYALDINSTAVLSNFSVNTINNAAVAAVPEPETYAMLIIGLFVISFVSKKRSYFNN